MAKKALSNLQPRAATIKSETVEGANTALRVGSYEEDVLDSVPLEYDPLSAYKQGQWVIFNGSLAQCAIATTAGQSPVSHKAKWSRKLITSADQIALGSELPVSANALAEALINLPASGGDIPNATTTRFGLARQASKEKVAQGTNDTDYTTPKDLHDALENYGDETVTQDLQTVTDEGATTTNAITAATSLSPARQPVNVFDVWGAYTRTADGQHFEAVPADSTAVTNALVNLLNDNSGANRSPIANALRLTLRSLFSLEADDNIVINTLNGSTVNYIIRKAVGAAGRFIVDNLGLGRVGSMGFRPDNAFTVEVGTSEKLVVDADRITTKVGIIQGDTKAYFREMGTSFLRMASSKAILLGAVYNPDNAIYEQMGIPDSIIGRKLIDSGDPVAVADWLRPFLQSVTVPGDARSPIQFYCRPAPVEPQSTQDFSLTPSLYNMDIGHNLQVSGEFIIPTIISPAKKNVTDLFDFEFSATAPWTVKVVPINSESTDSNALMTLRAVQL